MIKCFENEDLCTEGYFFRKKVRKIQKESLRNAQIEVKQINDDSRERNRKECLGFDSKIFLFLR